MSMMMHDREHGEANRGKSIKRCNKPLMEKKRRDRINTSLDTLKSMVLSALNKDSSQYSKLEKADILEMTVRHLKTMQRNQLQAASSVDSSVAGKFRLGYAECASEVARYLGSVDGLTHDVRDRLFQHLAGSCHQMSNTRESPMLRESRHMTSPQCQVPMATAVSTLPGNHHSVFQPVVASPMASPTYAAVTSPTFHQLPLSPPAGQSPPPQFAGAFHIVPGAVSPTQLMMSPTSNVMTVVVPPASPEFLGKVTPLYLNTYSPPIAYQPTSTTTHPRHTSDTSRHIHANATPTTPHHISPTTYHNATIPTENSVKIEGAHHTRTVSPGIENIAPHHITPHHHTLHHHTPHHPTVSSHRSATLPHSYDNVHRHQHYDNLPKSDDSMWRPW